MVSRNHLFHANDQAMDGEGQGVRNLSFLLVLISVFAGLGGSAALISVL